MKKRVLSLMLTAATIISMLSFAPAAQAISADDESVFVKQPKSSTCTVISCLNMLRRRAIIDGRDDWNEITYDAYSAQMTANGDGKNLLGTIRNVKDMTVGAGEAMRSKTTEQKKGYFLSLLENHPEGIVIYSYSNPMHAVLLTDYTDGTFYCVETTRSYPAGRIPLTSTNIGKGCSQDDAVAKIMQIWYITNRSGGVVAGLPAAATIQPGLYSLAPMCAPDRRLDVADGATHTGANVQIWRSNDTAAQQWNIESLGGGYYKLVCRESGKVLDVADAKKTSGTNVQQCIWTNNYAQHWRFTDAGDGYYHITTRLDANKRLDVNEREDANGTNVQIWEANNEMSQKWKLIPISQPAKPDHTHQKGTFQFNEAQHPHYGYYQCSLCGANFTDGSTIKMANCSTCYPNNIGAVVGTTSDTENDAAQRFVDFAVSQLGKKRADYGYTVSWCGYFVGWCSEQLGLQSILPPKANSANGVAAYQYILKHGGSGVRFYNDRSDMQTGTYLTDRNNYMPQIGDIVIFSWGSRAPAGHLYIDHVGIVQRVENGRIYVVHGNYHSGTVSGGIVCGPGCSVCGGASWPLNSDKIYAYARPDWASVSSGNAVTPPSQTETQQTPQVTEYFDCDIYIHTTAGQTVNAYANIFDAKRKNWFDKGQVLRCQKGAKGSDGSTWYQTRAVNARDELVTLWVNAGSPGITIEEIKPEPTPTPAPTPTPKPDCSNGHTWGSWKTTRVASCTQSGKRERTCSVCGTSQKESISALEHNYRVSRETDAAVTYTCSRCGDSYTKDKEQPKPETTPEPEPSAPPDVYRDGMFRDVGADDWFRDNVATVYELKLMKGTGEGFFSPTNNVTLAEAVTLAARIYSRYYGDGESFASYDGGNWYDPYVNYARAKGIISANYAYAHPATREEFVFILAQALPAEALKQTTGEIQFADATDIIYAGAVELLAGAGVINGVQENGLTYFKPDAPITRAEVAAIVGRMVQPGTRIGK